MEPVLIAGPKPLLTEFGIHYRLESCVGYLDLVCIRQVYSTQGRYWKFVGARYDGKVCALCMNLH